MSDLPFQLLRTKLHQPLPAPSLVPRQRLLDKLLDSPDAKLILVSASAGSGKTTLVVQWLERLFQPVAWLSLDETDNSLVAFLSGLTAAVQAAFPGACSFTQKLLRTPQTPPVDYLAAALINELSEVAEPFVLVLDDYHYIRDAAIHEVVSQLLRHMPRPLRLVITSRFDPPLPLSRLASRGQLVEIRAADLRFRPPEAQAMLQRVAGTALPEERVDALVNELEGWAVGLQSVAISLRQGDLRVEQTGDLFGSNYRQLVSILADEVFAQQPAEVREFLLRTSLLSQLTAPLCQALMAAGGSSEAVPVDSKAMLQRLERESLFIETLDEKHQWYRYHNLFRSFLAEKLQQSYDAGQIAALHRCAGQWYRDEGSADEAIRHALAAQDVSLAADVVEANLCDVLNWEDWPMLERWLALLPNETIQLRPVLLVAQAAVLYFRYKFQAIPPLLAQAEALVDDEASQAPVAPAVLGEVDALRTLMSFAVGNYEETVRTARRALSRIRPGNAFGRGHASFFLGLSLYALYGEAQSTEFYTRIIDDPLENVMVRARALLSMCHVFAIACRPVQQERAARILLRLCQEHDLVLGAAEAHRQLGGSRYERNDLEMAVQYYSLAVEQRYLLNFITARDSFVGLALAYQAQGRTGEAEAVANALQEFYLDRGLANLAEFDSSQARLAFLRGDADRALSLVERSRGANRSQAMTAYETATLTQAMIHLLAGSAVQRREAAALLPDLQLSAEASHATWHLIRILQLQAIALHRDGRTEKALAAMQRAVMLGYPDRAIRSVIELSAPIEPLLRQLAERGVEPAYIGELLAALQPQPTSQQPGSTAAGGSALVEPLSAREMEVLLLLNRRQSNKQIAAALVVSPLTVKRHMTNIMQKLGVDSRWEAVERARAIGLIPPA